MTVAPSSRCSLEPWLPARSSRWARLLLVGVGLAHAPVSAGAAEADALRSSGADAEHAPASPLWLRLRGGYARSSEPRERVFGVLELGIALDALVAGGSSAPALAAAQDGIATEGAASGRGSTGSASGGTAGGDTRERAFADTSERPAARPSAAPELTHELARATLAAAARVADAAASTAQLDSMLSRTRSSASLPEVRLAAGTSRDQSLRLTPTLTDPAKFTQDGGRDLWFEARLTWRLEHALFSHDEIAIQRLKAQALEARHRLLRQALNALLDWQRARQAQRSELLSDDERSAAELRELDAALRLDAWTDGWFSRHRQRTSGASRD